MLRILVPSFYVSVGKVSLYDNVKYINAGDHLGLYLSIFKISKSQSCLLIYWAIGFFLLYLSKDRLNQSFISGPELFILSIRTCIMQLQLDFMKVVLDTEKIRV